MLSKLLIGLLILNAVIGIYIVRKILEVDKESLDAFLKTEEIAKYNYSVLYEKILRGILGISFFNFTLSAIITMGKIKDIETYATKIEKLSVHIPVITTDGRYGIIKKVEIKKAIKMVKSNGVNI